MAIVLEGDGTITGVTTFTTPLDDIKFDSINVTGIATAGTFQAGTGVSMASPRSQNIALFTNNLEGLTLDDAGRLGIGISSPNQAADANNVKVVNAGIITANQYYGNQLTAVGSRVTGIGTFENGLNITGNITNGLNVSAGIATFQAVTGTTGTFTGDVSIADKIIHTGDTNTAIRFPAADTVTVETGGTEAIRVNSTQQVGIGTDNPSSPLQVHEGDIKIQNNAGGTDGLYIRNATSTFAWTGEHENSAIPNGAIGMMITNNDVATNKSVALLEFRTYRNSASNNPGGVLIGAVDIGDGSAHSSDCIFALKDGSATVKERLRITHDGKLLVGSDTLRTIGGSGSNGQVQIEGTSTNLTSLAIINNQNNANASCLNFGKTRGTSTGAVTTVADGDNLGMIRWSGADGTDLENSTALIKAIVNGTVSGNTIPTDIVFQTSATSGSAKAERVRIDSAGLVGIGTDSPQRLLHLMGGTAGTTILFTNPNTGNTTSDGSQINIRNDDNGFTLSQNENSYMNFRVNGSERARITSTGLFGIGTNAPVNLLQVEGSAPIIAIRDTASFSAYTNGGKIYFQGTDSTGAVKSFAGIRGVSQSSNNGQLRLQTRTGGTLYDRLTLNAAGQALFTAEGTADNGSIGIQSDEPFIRLEDTNGVANEKKWDMRVVGSSGNQQLMFRTVNDANNSFTTRLQLLHGGDVSIDDGNLVVANGHGIDFSASESGDATAGQSILDDYEQGSFTAYLYGHTTGSGSDRCTGTGYYTKVGNVVTCTLTFSNQNGNNLNDGEQVRVAGMPFTMHANGGNQTSSNIFSYNIGFETDEVHMFICASNASYLRGYRSRNVATWQPWSTTEFTVSGIYLTFNVTYLGLV